MKVDVTKMQPGDTWIDPDGDECTVVSVNYNDVKYNITNGYSSICILIRHLQDQFNERRSHSYKSVIDKTSLSQAPKSWCILVEKGDPYNLLPELKNWVSNHKDPRISKNGCGYSCEYFYGVSKNGYFNYNICYSNVSEARKEFDTSLTVEKFYELILKKEYNGNSKQKQEQEKSISSNPVNQEYDSEGTPSIRLRRKAIALQADQRKALFEDSEEYNRGEIARQERRLRRNLEQRR